MKNTHNIPLKNIVIQESWWCDERRHRLAHYLADLRKADGAVIELWGLARLYLSKGELIPSEQIQMLEDKDALILSGLLVEEKNGFYARGSRALYSLRVVGK